MFYDDYPDFVRFFSYQFVRILEKCFRCFSKFLTEIFKAFVLHLLNTFSLFKLRNLMCIQIFRYETIFLSDRMNKFSLSLYSEFDYRAFKYFGLTVHCEGKFRKKALYVTYQEIFQVLFHLNKNFVVS